LKIYIEKNWKTLRGWYGINMYKLSLIFIRLSWIPIRYSLLLLLNWKQTEINSKFLLTEKIKSGSKKGYFWNWWFGKILSIAWNKRDCRINTTRKLQTAIFLCCSIALRWAVTQKRSLKLRTLNFWEQKNRYSLFILKISLSQWIKLSGKIKKHYGIFKIA